MELPHLYNKEVIPVPILEVTPEALATIETMNNRVHAVAAEYGVTSDEYHDVAESLRGVLLQLIRLGGHISGDGDMSLYGASFIHYGVIWFPRKIEGGHDPLLGEWSCHS